MRFVGRLAIILLVAVGAAVAHSMQWPITRDGADALARRDAKVGTKGGQSDTSGESTAPERGEDPAPEVEDPPVSDPGPTSAPDPVVEAEDTAPPDLPEYYISVEDAYDFWEEGMAFIDARTDSERTVGTVEGAFHLQTQDFITGLAQPVLDQIDPAFPVIIFCGGGDCDASENVFQRLVGRLYEEVYIMHEGYGAWEAAGHPTEPVGGG